MSRTVLVSLIVFVASLAATGCGTSVSAPAKQHAADPRFLLTAEPSSALSVLSFKDQAKSGETVAVIGRIGGGIDPWIERRSAFLLVDSDAPLPCADDQCGPDCPHCAQEIKDSATMVKFVDAEGKTLAIDTRELLGVKEEETVVVQGVARRDAAGNVALMATGVYIKR